MIPPHIGMTLTRVEIGGRFYYRVLKITSSFATIIRFDRSNDAEFGLTKSIPLSDIGMVYTPVNLLSRPVERY